MTGKEAIVRSGRSETWLRNHQCAWCGETLWRALLYGCGAIFDKCEPWDKDFSVSARRDHDGITEHNTIEKIEGRQ